MVDSEKRSRCGSLVLMKGQTMLSVNKPEFIQPNPQVLDLTSRIVAQNEKILQINEHLLKMLTSPMMVVDLNTLPHCRACNVQPHGVRPDQCHDIFCFESKAGMTSI